LEKELETTQLSLIRSKADVWQLRGQLGAAEKREKRVEGENRRLLHQIRELLAA
jgi:hypothetical protein